MTQTLAPEERSLDNERGAAIARAQFPRVGQMAPEHQQALQVGFHQWQGKLAKELSGLLRVPCASQPARPHSVPRAALSQGLGERFAAHLNGQPECPVLLSLPRPFAVSVCERLFGAPMAAREARPLSPAEISLLRDLAIDFLASLGACFGGIRFLPGDPPEESRADMTEEWLVVDCPVRCTEVDGAISAAFAPETAQRLLGASPVVVEARPTPEDVLERLGEVPLDLQAILGATQFTLVDLTGLRVGDVITLDRHAQDLVDIRIEERLFFQARAGLAGQTIALEIAQGPQKVEEA